MSIIKKKNLNLYRGDTHSFLIKAKGIDLNSISKIDLEAIVDKNIVIELSSDDNSIIKNEQGIIVKFNSDTTKSAEWVKAEYDLQLTFNDGRIKTILKGLIILEHDITREV